MLRFRPIVQALLLALPLASAAAHAHDRRDRDPRLGEVSLERVWTYAHKSVADGPKAEIVAFDRKTDTLWVAGVTGVDVLDRATGQRIANIPVGQFGAVNSVAVKKGVAALAIENGTDRTLPGVVVFIDTETRRQLGAPVTVGALPDMLTFTPDGRRVLVANEGTPNPRPAPAGLSAEDPAGSVSVIDVRSRRVLTLPITADIPGYDTLRSFPATLGSYDPEPETIAVDESGDFAWVGLQEANGVAVLDLRELRFTHIFSLGRKDFSQPGNEIDPTDRTNGVTDGKVEFVNVPVFGLYQPDSIASYRYRGHSYFVLANEGDSRDNGNFDSEDERRGGAGSGPDRLSDDPLLARLTLSNVDSVRGGPLVAFGGRSVSIRDASGALVWDSGSLLDREAHRLGLYDDTRSDNKGAEPEGIALLEVGDHVLAFVGLERAKQSAFAVFDVTDPHDVRYIDLIVSPGDISPEGLTAFRADGRHWVAVAHEVTDTTSLFELRIQRRR